LLLDRSVEPEASNFRLLTENTKANCLDTVPLEAAVIGNSDKHRTLYLHRKSSAHRNADAESDPGNQGINAR
jgi:hypothetical protein